MCTIVQTFNRIVRPTCIIGVPTWVAGWAANLPGDLAEGIAVSVFL